MPVRASLSDGGAGGPYADRNQLPHLLARHRPDQTKAPTAPWPGKDHHGGSGKSRSLQCATPQHPEFPSPGTQTKPTFHPWTRLKIPPYRPTCSLQDGWPVCNPPGKGGPFPHPGEHRGLQGGIPCPALLAGCPQRCSHTGPQVAKGSRPFSIAAQECTAHTAGHLGHVGRATGIFVGKYLLF